MAQVSGDTPIVKDVPHTDDGPLTVPSGEIWVVSVTTEFAQWLFIDGHEALYFNDDNGHGCMDTNIPLVITGGSELSHSSSGDNMRLSGFEVSNTVDNTPVCAIATHGTDITVPDGETWYGSVICGRNYTITVNGNGYFDFDHSGYDDSRGANQTQSKHIFESGDVISSTGSYTSGWGVLGWSL